MSFNNSLFFVLWTDYQILPNTVVVVEFTLRLFLLYKALMNKGTRDA